MTNIQKLKGSIFQIGTILIWQMIKSMHVSMNNWVIWALGKGDQRIVLLKIPQERLQIPLYQRLKRKGFSALGNKLKRARLNIMKKMKGRNNFCIRPFPSLQIHTERTTVMRVRWINFQHTMETIWKGTHKLNSWYRESLPTCNRQVSLHLSILLMIEISTMKLQYSK